MKVLLINSDEGPDYLADLVNYFFITHKYEVFTNHNMDYLFNDFQNTSNLYGKGFTLYGKIKRDLKSNVTTLTEAAIFDMLPSFEVVIFTSIHRTYKGQSVKLRYFYKFSKKLKTKDIIVLDGEDFVDIDNDIASQSNYFKRELIDKNKNAASSISFSFPEFEISSDNNFKKTQILAPMDPRFQNSYTFNESEYFEQYKRSIFGVTTKKAGWDCLRHYEILSTKTLLYFPGIENKPSLTMEHFPVKMQIEINKLFLKLISSYENLDSLEKIRLNYYSKKILLRAIKKVKRKMSSLHITENNFKNLENLNKDMNQWFTNFGTSKIYKLIFKI